MGLDVNNKTKYLSSISIETPDEIDLQKGEGKHSE